MLTEQRLFSKAGYIPGVRRRPEPDWAVVELDIVAHASDNTIGRTLEKTSSNPIVAGNG